MKFKPLITINSFLALVTGVACVVMPATLLAIYEVNLSPMGLVIYQFWGVALIGLGILTWSSRKMSDVALQKRFAMALLITNGLSCVMAVRGQFAGANASGWSTVVLFLLLTLGFGVFLCTENLN